MHNSRTLRFLLSAVAVIAFSAGAFGQATRTWVSGVGDDVNPCSRTAPCKTWAGAISKTAEGGEIDALDPGGFGTITITKAMTLEGTHGSGFGSILNAGGIAGVNVNITGGNHVNDAVVILRSLYIQGASQSPVGGGGGTHGINVIKGHRVFVYDCHIEGQVTTGINMNISTGSSLFVRDTDFSNTNTGINVASTVAGQVVIMQADNINVQGCSAGVVLGNSAGSVFGFVTGSVLSRNIGGNASSAGSNCTLNLTHDHFHANTTAINANAGSAVRVNECEIFDNTNGFAGNAASIQSGGNNKLAGNAASIAPTGTPLTNQ
jgi:hypothetical protein